MPMRILIIHEFGVARKITQEYILTEFSDAITELVASPLEASHMLDEEKYDVVFCGFEMSAMDGLALHKHLLGSKLNHETPFIIMTSSYSEVQVERLARRGVRYVLPIPFTPLQLRNMIYDVSDPRSRRVHTRHSIPGAIAMMKFGDQQVQADVINISINGILCGLACPKPPIDFMGASTITILFPDDYGRTVAGDIKASLLRLTAESWREDYSPKQVRLALKFVEISRESEKILMAAFEKARKELLEAEGLAKKQNI
jgi:CheY-like chemotaxis protein